MVSDILTWFEQEATLLQAIAAVAAILTFGGTVIWGAFRLIRWAATKPKPVQVEATVRLADDLPVLTPVQWIRTQEVMRESIIAQLDRADDEERKRLQARIAELTARINDPEGAFEAQRKRLADLEDKLLREGNELGAERLNSAIAKLRAGNTDEAEAIFSEIAEREAMAVQRAARAEFGLGEIAESRVDWRAAAQHYARAAELDPSYDTLLRAGNLLWRAGQYEAALDTNKRLVAFSKQEHGARDPKTATAVNNYASLLRAIGRYAEAEPLFRAALEITRETLGDRHPAVAIRLNNLAGLLRDTERYAEAVPLYLEATAIFRAALSDDHPDTQKSVRNTLGHLREHAPDHPDRAGLEAVFGTPEQP